tara:strand:- start:99 stop:659 length:561 start_codon:yes stop_codon:yes gene_type:complete
MSEEYCGIIEENKEMLLDILENVNNKTKENIKCDIMDCLENYAKNQVPSLIAQVSSDDPKACFDIVNIDLPADKNYFYDGVDLGKMDYSIPRSKEAIDKGIQEDLPISFLQIQEGEIEKGKGWYLQRFPKLPDSMAELMARYNWGDLKYQTKKKIKNDKKKLTKRGKKYEPLAFKIERGSFTIDFT